MSALCCTKWKCLHSSSLCHHSSRHLHSTSCTSTQLCGNYQWHLCHQPEQWKDWKSLRWVMRATDWNSQFVPAEVKHKTCLMDFIVLWQNQVCQLWGRILFRTLIWNSKLNNATSWTSADDMFCFLANMWEVLKLGDGDLDDCLLDASFDYKVDDSLLAKLKEFTDVVLELHRNECIVRSFIVYFNSGLDSYPALKSWFYVDARVIYNAYV